MKIVGPQITKKGANWKVALGADEILAITLLVSSIVRDYLNYYSTCETIVFHKFIEKSSFAKSIKLTLPETDLRNFHFAFPETACMKRVSQVCIARYMLIIKGCKIFKQVVV